jgi:hypothetical protein
MRTWVGNAGSRIAKARSAAGKANLVAKLQAMEDQQQAAASLEQHHGDGK